MAGGVLTFRELKTLKKWPFSRGHTRRLVRSGKFPKPFKASDGPSSSNLWLESEIDAYLAERNKTRP